MYVPASSTRAHIQGSPLKATISIRPSTVAPATAISPGPLSPPAPSLCSGPTSGTTTILPRPKPGRKPASDEPENKRKAQNRAAQRAFRERKLQGQQQLELENKDLKQTNDGLSREIKQLKDNIASGQAVQARLDQDLTESRRRESELLSQHERDMSTVAAFEQRTREAELKTATYLNELHTLRAEVAILRAKAHRPLRHADKREASVPPANITNPIGGCDDCGKDGTCPCVDTFLDANETDRTISRHSMPIESMLSPPDSASDPARMNSIPELVSDHSSPEDMEIDFTHAFKPSAGILPKAERCGFCEDGGKCICAEAEAEMGLVLPAPAPAISLATKQPQPMPAKTVKPGTCPQCQADPKQKAYCESLARTRLEDRGEPEGEPASKRTRTSTSKRDVSVPCSDAYELYKRYSSSKDTPSYDDVYRDYVKSHPKDASSRRTTVSTTATSGSGESKFSAYETDIAAVIATLHQQPSSGSSSSKAKSRRAPKT